MSDTAITTNNAVATKAASGGAAKSLLKGLLSGLIGGIAATAAKAAAERFYAARAHDGQAAGEALATRLAGHELEPAAKRRAGRAITFGLGAAAGAAYGAAAEYFPAATDKEGASFGLALMAITHQAPLRGADPATPTDKETLGEHTNDAATHILFGVVAERVRRFVRGLMH